MTVLSATVVPMVESITLEILNTGAGHLRITFDPGEPAEVAKAKDTISLLLRRGFALFLHEGDQVIRVRDFDPERGSYYVDAAPEDAGPDEPVTRKSGKPDRRRGPHKGRRAVPAAGRRVTAVGRTAGG